MTRSPRVDSDCRFFPEVRTPWRRSARLARMTIAIGLGLSLSAGIALAQTKGSAEHIKAVTSAVDSASIKANAATSSDWPTIGLDYGETRFSKLNQINADNVKKLGLVWSYGLESSRGVEVDDSASQRLHDPLSTDRCPDADRTSAGEDDPHWHLVTGRRIAHADQQQVRGRILGNLERQAERPVDRDPRTRLQVAQVIRGHAAVLLAAVLVDVIAAPDAQRDVRDAGGIRLAVGGKAVEAEMMRVPQRVRCRPSHSRPSTSGPTAIKNRS